MNIGLKNRLTEVPGSNNIAYILNDSNDFSITGFKVMENQTKNGLVKCAKVIYNGKTKLVYIIENYKPLSVAVSRIGINELYAVIFNLIQKAIDIKSNGFFRAENLELDFDKIFVDLGDYSVHLIYFPISNDNTGSISSFENEFRVMLIKLFNTYPVFNAPQFQRLCIDLANGAMSFEQVLKKLYESVGGQSSVQKVPPVKTPPVPTPPKPRPPVPAPVRQPQLTVTAINSPVQLVLRINIPEYSIGKNAAMVNGAITYNPAISRKHCKIFYSRGTYYLTDLGSANGTYINQRRLQPNETCKLLNGDYIRLANSDFIVNY